jgi:hypothetical protein
MGKVSSKIRPLDSASVKGLFKEGAFAKTRVDAKFMAATEEGAGVHVDAGAKADSHESGGDGMMFMTEPF